MNLARVLAVATSLVSTPVLAISPGNIVSCTGSSAFTCSPPFNEVQDGAEIDLVGPAFDFVLYFDFSQDLLTVTESASEGLILIQSDADATPSFTNTPETFLHATLLNSNVSGLDQSDISLFGGVLTLDLRDTLWTADSTFQIDFAEPVTPPSVPEPATWATMFIGFATAASVMRRRRKNAWAGSKRAHS